MEIKLHNGATLRIEREQYTESPRKDYDNLWTWVTNNERYFSSDRNADESMLDKYFDGDEDEVREIEENYLIVPIYAYIHSGCTVSLNKFFDPFDRGVGFVAYVAKADLEKNKISEEQATEELRGEVEMYDLWLNGNTFWYELTDENGDLDDSCGGFFGIKSLVSSLRDYELIPKEDVAYLESLEDYDID